MPQDLHPNFHFANEIQPHTLQWLWPNRFPLGKLSLIVGDPGLGKSLLAADLAARVSAGCPLPEPSIPVPPAPSFPAGVVIAAPEDSIEDTLIPRLAAAGADLTRICILDGITPADRVHGLSSFPQSLDPSVPGSLDPSIPSPLLLPTHAPALQETIRAVTHPRLVILDPLHAVLATDARSGIGALTAALEALADTARSYNVAVIAIGHLTKTRTLRTIYRVNGSLALVAAARAVHVLVADPDRSDRRILTPLKTVHGPPPPPLAFRITNEPRLIWDDPRPDPQSPNPTIPDPLRLLNLPADANSALADACDWLIDYLAAGPRPVIEILRDARDAGHTRATLLRAKRALAVRSIKPALDTGWLWTPSHSPPPEHAQKQGAQP